MIIWITGLSAAGKTTIGSRVVSLWKEQRPNVVFMDGDEMRRVLARSEGEDAYAREGRHNIAMRYSYMCEWLDAQGIDVVCCTIAFFDDIRERNREAFSAYFEVYIDAPMDVLQRRDKKGLYTRASKGEVRNVVGVDLILPPPANPDMTVDNSTDMDDVTSIAARILTAAQDQSGVD